jgi:endonuclease/exonuclease/phosphatase family metal-dependent hydrolase
VRKLAALLAAAAAALAAISPAVSSSDPPRSGSGLSLLQMNLCLSGRAGCFARTDYPSVLDEATAQIVGNAPTAVTINEACRDDVAEIARRTGYDLSFAVVDYGGAPLPCITPGGRGFFGIAVLTKGPILASHDEEFAVQADPEARRWLCATTSQATVCTAHLSTRYSTLEREANDAECRELLTVLARYDAAGTTLFGGDMNRQSSCAPATMWTTRDTAAGQSPGVQHVYGTTSVDRPSASVAEATHTDHDFLLAASSAAP